MVSMWLAAPFNKIYTPIPLIWNNMKHASMLVPNRCKSSHKTMVSGRDRVSQSLVGPIISNYIQSPKIHMDHEHSVDLYSGNSSSNPNSWQGRVVLIWGWWLVVCLPLWKMMEFVSWDYDIPNIWKNKSHVPNHQPDSDFAGCGYFHL